MDFDNFDSNKKKLLEGLVKYKGIVTSACKYAKVSRQTYYNYLEDSDFKKAVEDVSNTALDFVEGKLFSLIEQENPTAIIFYLKTKGKKRGYVERQEITGADGDAIKTEHKQDLSKLSIDELKQLRTLNTKLRGD